MTTARPHFTWEEDQLVILKEGADVEERTSAGAVKAWKSRRRNLSLADSLMQEGGFSYNPFKLPHSPPAKGFMVSLPGHEKSFKGKDRKELAHEIGEHIRKHQKQLKGEKGAYAGGWRDDDGTIYLDVSQHVMSKKKAIALGREREQIAIFDLATGEAINTGGQRAWYDSGRYDTRREEEETDSLPEP